MVYEVGDVVKYKSDLTSPRLIGIILSGWHVRYSGHRQHEYAHYGDLRQLMKFWELDQ